MFGTKQNDDRQMDMCERLEQTLTPAQIKEQKRAANAARQSRYRARQRLAGRKAVTMLLTYDEKYFLERVLEGMRENKGSYPAALRSEKGTYIHLDV